MVDEVKGFIPSVFLVEHNKGSLSDRKIFELAALQSNRESAQVGEIEIRDETLERLIQALMDRDGDLAHAEKVAEDVSSQVEELCRIRRREDVSYFFYSIYHSFITL
jgi:hypothetical protein